MITRKEAEKAKESLLSMLRDAEWLKGVTLGLGGSGISIRVAVNGDITDAIRAAVPPMVQGVEVILEQAIVSMPFDERWLK